RVREVIGQKAAEFRLAENPGIAPFLILEWADVENIDNQQVAGLSAGDADRSGQMVARRQIDIANIVGAVIVGDLAAGPVEAFDAEGISWPDHRGHRNIRMPAIDDDRRVLLCRQPLAINTDYLFHRIILLIGAVTRPPSKTPRDSQT